MIFGPAKIVGRSILGCVCQRASEVNCDTKGFARNNGRTLGNVNSIGPVNLRG